MEREFAYRFPRWWRLIMGLVMLLGGAAAVIVPCMGGTPFTADSLADKTELSTGALLAYGMGAALLIGTGLIQTVVVAKTFRARAGARRRIRLSADSLLMPRGFRFPEDITVRYEDIEKIGTYGWLGRRNIVIVHAGGRAKILGIGLSSQSDNEALIAELAGRTSLPPVPMLRVPRQFSLSSLLILTTVFSVVLGLRTSYSRTLGWLDLAVPLGATLALGAIIFVVSRRSWTPRIFIIGFVGGGLIDAMTLAAICGLAGVDSTLLDRTWFPLSAVVLRMNYNIHALGWGTGWEETGVLTCGAAISGAICGLAAAGVCRWISSKPKRMES